VSSRRDEKERLRQERIAQQDAEAKAASRRRLTAVLFAAVVLAAAAIAGVVVVATSGGGSSSSDAGQTYSKNSVPAAAEVGVQTTPPPWRPEYAHLAQRLKAMGLPGLNEQIFHIHSWLHVYVDGKAVTVPVDIGLDQSTGTFSPLHTHDTSGIIHMEADRTYPFTIGQVFAVWGVEFTNDQLGPYKSGGGKQLQVYVNGNRITDPVDYVMHEHDNIAVGYGKPGSFPSEPPANFPSGL
jgi:hypothetical protein